MTRFGRFLAGVGAVVLGLALTLPLFVAIDAFIPKTSVAGSLVRWLVGSALFGIVTAALYTWAVDGPFVRGRRSH